MSPESITLHEIKSETNAEVRRVMREAYGQGRYLADIGAIVVDVDSTTTHKRSRNSQSITRALIEDNEQNRFLVGTDGSTGRTYYMKVDPTMNTCVEAHEYVSGLNENQMIAQS